MPNSAYSLVISDLHLSEKRPESFALFQQFICEKAVDADALYILGDFFDFWVGDDDLSEFHQQVAASLKTLHDSETQLYLMVGNRDFLIGRQFLDSCHAKRLADPSDVKLYNLTIRFTHGDLLCTKDYAYQRFRRVVHQRWLQMLFLKLPLSWRRAVAAKIRQASRGSRYFSDVDVDAASAYLQGKDYLIHGHTHEFATHGKRIVLGDWHAVGSYVEIQADEVLLKSYP